MAPTLYMIHPSPPVRAVLMTAEAIGLTLNEQELNLLEGEHLKPEYLKLNPQHTVPTLVDDDGFSLWDSHAIMVYLVSKYAKNDSLYPKDIRKRAVVDQRLHFDSGTAFARLLRITRPIVFDGRTTIFEDDQNNMIEVYSLLDKFLEGKKWTAGDTVTLADYSLGTTIGSIAILVPVDSSKYPNVASWLKRFEELPEFAVNKKGLNLFEALFKTKLGRA